MRNFHSVDFVQSIGNNCAAWQQILKYLWTIGGSGDAFAKNMLCCVAEARENTGTEINQFKKARIVDVIHTFTFVDYNFTA